MRFHEKLIADLAGRYRLPSIAAASNFAKEGGLMDYGSNIEQLGQFRQAANYVDRIVVRSPATCQCRHRPNHRLHRRRGDPVKRREFIAGLGSAVAWPLAARAQSSDRMRRIGVLLGFGENDPGANPALSGFMQGLTEFGWIDGRNLRMDVRWAAGNVDRAQTFAKELVNLQPDVILTQGTSVTAALQRETRTIPIVFAVVADPVGAGFVAGLPRPGGNITGFINLEASMAGKWLELLTEIAPAVKRAAIMFNPDTAPGGGSYYLPAFEAAARSLQMEPITAPVHSDTEIETIITSLGRREPGGGLVVMTDDFMYVHRAPIILLAARNNVPAVYFLSVCNYSPLST
jgi:putative tryptophan/tyrosine transport system substrate-binding protein